MSSVLFTFSATCSQAPRSPSVFKCVCEGSPHIHYRGLRIASSAGLCDCGSICFTVPAGTAAIVPERFLKTKASFLLFSFGLLPVVMTWLFVRVIL